MRRSQRAFAAAFFGLVLFHALAVRAEVKLPAIIGDRMVLQREMKVPIWGWADPGEKVTVTLDDQKVETVAGQDGRWKAWLEPLKAGGPFEMTVAGKNTLVLKDILVGEVWVGSGQSNMAMAVKGCNQAEKEVAEARLPRIRLFTVRQATATEPQTDVKGEWVECSPQTVGSFSGALFFFGREIYNTLNLPVGLINTSWGGTPAEAWTSGAALEAEPSFKAIFERAKQYAENYPKTKENWEKNREQIMAKFKENLEKARAEGKPAPRPPRPPDDPASSPHRPAVLYNAMLAPLMPYAIRGAIWYQGESNAGRAFQYRKLFSAMISDWRKNWGEGDFPFFFVQLANYRARKDQPGESDWAELREAQALALALPKTGMAVIMDIGETNDIHPKNKQDVGKRLALAAQAVAYGKDVVYSGPRYDSMKVDGGKVRLSFKHAGGGLVAKGEKLTGFAVAGEDKKFVWADAAIEGEAVVVSSKDVAAPVAVRYAWADNPDCSLYNKEGLPASPFRTDDWPGVTVGKE
jgi:sialate O-acetylesterase